MPYCGRCRMVYLDDDTCMCPYFQQWCESSEKYRVPLAWKLDWWDGYVNDPWDCEHLNIRETRDGRMCRDCGEEIYDDDDDDGGHGYLLPSFA